VSTESVAEPSKLNDAVAVYYDTTLDLYEDLWGEHVHHGYWDPGDSPANGGASRHEACDRTVRELVAFAGLRPGSTVLDVGCGIGGPALYLARDLDCTVEGITLSAQQAARATEKAAAAGVADRTRFRVMDMLTNDLAAESVDVVWAVESVMHMPDLPKFFAEALRVLRPGGRLAVTIWAVRHGGLTEAEERLHQQVQRHQVIAPLKSIEDHVELCRAAGFAEVASADWSVNVANSWDPAFAMVESPERGREFMREIAREKGVDVLGFFYAGPIMKRGFDDGVITYGALRAIKPGAGTRSDRP
jgi:tocopherol O-methyltransferase